MYDIQPENINERDAENDEDDGIELIWEIDDDAVDYKL